MRLLATSTPAAAALHHARAPFACMCEPPPPPPQTPLSSSLLAIDGALLFCYSLSASIAALFTSGEYLEPAIVQPSDFIDITLALDSAASLALGWGVASVATGVCSEDWLGLDADEHVKAPLGLAGVLSNWLLAWPLGVALKCLAAYGLAYEEGGAAGIESWRQVLEGAAATAAAQMETAAVGVDAAPEAASSALLASEPMVGMVGSSVLPNAPLDAAGDASAVLASMFDANAAAMDGAGMLIVIFVWRSWLLSFWTGGWR